MDSGPTDQDFTMISVYLARIITSDGRMEMVGFHDLSSRDRAIQYHAA